MESMHDGTFTDIAKYKLEQASDDLEAAEILLNAEKYKAANNRAYYACFHAIGAVLALEPVAFKRHKDTLAYFNKNYIHTEIFPKDMGRRIAKLEIIRHKSDYDFFYVISKEESVQQMETAQEIIILVEQYLEEFLQKKKLDICE